jgi:UDP-N-acetylmuramoylalanine--D-glutamate ligase
MFHEACDSERPKMPTVGDLNGKRVVVLGLARQGIALARFLAQQGARVAVSDVKTADQLTEAVKSLADLSIRYVLGGHPIELLDGCDVLCLSGGVPVDLPIVVQAQQRGIELANDAQIFIERCAAPVIGITGSAGKTTTTALTGEMLKAAGFKTWVGGNIGNPLIADLASIESGDKVVMELSSFQLEVMTTSPHIAAVLNITPNHLDRHPSMGAYIAAKKRILDFQDYRDVAVLGYDDAEARKLAGDARGYVRFFSQQSLVGRGAFVRGGKIVLQQDEEQSVCAVSDLKLRGPHNVWNVLAACALAGEAGASVEAMAQVATSFAGVAHRLQLVRELRGVRYYDDSIATAPERLIAALRSFDEPLVLLCGGRDKHLPWEEAARLIAERVSHLVLFGEMAELVESQILNLKSQTPALRAGASVSNLKVHEAGTLENAVELAAQLAQPGDVVLLSPGGTSFDAFKDFAERGDRFAEIVKGLE